MYHDYKLEDIIQELKDEKADAIARLEAWRKVEIARKKDGSEFQCITRALKNAKITAQYGIHNELVVYYHTAKGGYQHDKIRAYIYGEDLPEGDPRKRMYSGIYWCDMTAEELRKAVADHIEYLSDYINQLDFDMSDAPSAYRLWIDAILEAENALRSAVSRHLFGKIAYATNFSWSDGR